MQAGFRAFRIYAQQVFERAAIESLRLADLSAGDVIIKVHYSSVNYKDALAGSGRGKILRQSPLVGGIDLAGEVVSSSHPVFSAGQLVLVNGSGLSETHDGGYSEYARVPSDWVVTMPDGLQPRTAMLIGTAGFTAGLAIQRLLDNHQTPEQGPILVTGASGGVGSYAIQLLHQLGFEVIALTRKTDAHDYLTGLGASQVLAVEQLKQDDAQLHKGLWAGAIDNLGGTVLASLTKSVKPWGNIVSVGTAAISPLPVLGVPVPSKHLQGQDSLLSIVQMPKGVPVATFAIGAAGARNAGLFAVAMFANSDPQLAAKLAQFRQTQSEQVLAKVLPPKQ